MPTRKHWESRRRFVDTSCAGTFNIDYRSYAMDLTRNYLMVRVFLWEMEEDLETAKPENRKAMRTKIGELQNREAKLRKMVDKKDYQRELKDDLRARIETGSTSEIALRRIETLEALLALSAKEEW
jgi:hypothetical protein